MKLTYNIIIIALISNIATLGTTLYFHNQVLLLAIIAFSILIISIWLIHKNLVKQMNATPSIERRLSLRSPYTNNSLLKRVQFGEMLKQAIEKANQLNKHFAILLINLEPTYISDKSNVRNVMTNFTSDTINMLKNMLKPEDTIAYINDDELVILITDVDKPKLAGNIAQRIIDHFTRPHLLNGLSNIIKATIGVAIYPTDGSTIDDIIENAQKALYKAKISDKQLFQYHIDDNGFQQIDQKNIQSLFKQALRNNQIQILFQPIFDLKKGDVTSVQALLRWEHPQLGIINPEIFIITAEETSTLALLSEWMLREICEKINYWNKSSCDAINVLLKISPSQFLLPTLPNIIQHVLMHSGIEPRYLNLSIDETIIMKNIDVAKKILKDLKETGVTLGIDHFGSSYTSLAQIDNLPIQYITLSKALLTSQASPFHPSRTMINAAIALGKEFGFEIIAEGVETAEQLDYLINQECDKALGYLLSYPVVAEKINYQFNNKQSAIKTNE